MSSEELSLDCEWLRRGQILVYPTETCWGLGVDAFNASAVDKLFESKGRATMKAMSVLVSELSMAIDLAVINTKVRRALEVFWPGPVTFVLPLKDPRLKLVAGGGDWIGLRCSSHPYVQRLVAEYKGPITTTSANLSGKPSAMKRSDLSWVPESFRVTPEVEAFGRSANLVLKIEDDRFQVLRAFEDDQEKYLKILSEIGFQQGR